MSRISLGVALLAGATLALGVLGPASARTDAAPKYGGTLIFGTGSDASSLDPTVSTGTVAEVIYRTMCLRLYEYNKSQLDPVLAAAVPVFSKDKLSYTIQLRQGIQFNDGSPFNAQAVVANYQRYTTYPGSTRALDFTFIDRITASGPYTVVYHLTQRSSIFTGNMWVLSPTQLAKLGDNFGSNPICVGPFMYDHRVVGDHVTVIKSPYYYDKGRVYLDKIVFKQIPDAAAAAAALKAGDIHVSGVSTTELQGVQQTSRLRVLQSPLLGWRGIHINIGNRNGVGNLPYAKLGTPLASSAKLRQAFEEAIDRTTLSRVVYGGLVQPSCTPIAPSNAAWFDATKVPCTRYNPSHAKKLVAASGFPNPTVRLLVGSATDDLRLAQFIQAQEAAVGINVVIDRSPSGVSSTAIRGDFDTVLGGTTPGSADPHGNINSIVATDGRRNYSGYTNPRLDLILSNGLKATDVKARSTLYRTAQQIILNDRPVIFLYTQIVMAAFSGSLAGVELDPTGSLSVVNARFK